MTGSLPHSGGEEGSLLHSGGRSRAETGCFSRLPLLDGGFTLRGRWMSQLHRECRDRRNGSQLGFRLFFTTLGRGTREPVTSYVAFPTLLLLPPSPQPQVPTSVLQTSCSLWSSLVL